MVAAQYYVDFENGSNSNTGTSSGAPWKHCPGDANATGNANITLAAGDTVNFINGTVYQGQITVNASGTAGNRITFNGAPAGTKATIDGTTNITWNVCTAEGTGATQVQNASFSSIYYATLPTGLDWTLLLIEDGKLLTHAGSPNTVDPFFYNDTDYMQAISSGISSGACTDAAFFNSSDANYWVGGVIVYHATGNSTAVGIITNFNTATDTVQYSGSGTPYQASDWDNKYHYTVINSQRQITRGTYAVDTAGGRILCWPTNDITKVRVSYRPFGFHGNGASYITITNFIISGQWGATYQAGRMISGSTSTPADGLAYENNDLRYSVDGGATASIYTLGNGTTTNIVRGNSLYRIYGRGIFGSGNRWSVQTNYLTNITGTVLYSQNTSTFTNRNGQFLGNWLVNCRGTHANGITVYGNGSVIATDVLVAGNHVIGQYHRFGPFAVSMQAHRNIQFENNILDGNIADDGAATGSDYLRWLNNTITGSLRFYSAANSTDAVVKNNIIGNGLWNNTGESWSDIDYSHNIYTNLNFRQAAMYGWTIGTGESVTNLSAIFGAGGFTDGTIPTTSVAEAAGTDTTSLMINDYDAFGNVWTQPMDIGAAQGTPVIANNTPRPQSLRILFRQK